MAKLINGNGNPAVYASEDSDWFAAIMGNTTAITAIGEQFRADQADANTIEVFDGVIITQEGRRIQLDVNDVDLFEIPTGTPGDTNYYIIGYHLVTDTDSNQSCETFVQKMDDGSETIPENTFRGGADDVYISLYRVTQTGLNITSIDLLLPYIGTIGDLKPIPEYTVCTTGASTVSKTATIDGFELVTGAKVTVNFAYKNTASSPTLNISATGAKSIRKRTGNSTYTNFNELPYGPVDLVYDGTYWLVQEGSGGVKAVYRGTISMNSVSSVTVNHNKGINTDKSDISVQGNGSISGNVAANMGVYIDTVTSNSFAIKSVSGNNLSGAVTLSWQIVEYN